MTKILAVISDFLLSVKTDTILKNHRHKLEYLKEDTKRDMYQFCVKQIVEYEKISKK